LHNADFGGPMVSKAQVTVLVVGPFPPPIHGAALVTQLVGAAFSSYAHVVRCDVSPGRLQKTWMYHITRMQKFFAAIRQIFKYSRADNKTIYLTSAGGFGNLYNFIICILGRIFRYKIIIHHHSFAYLENTRFIVLALVCAAGIQAKHVVLCPRMDKKLRARYRGIRNTQILSNAALLHPNKTLPSRAGGWLRLGHLSNLSPEKGINTTIALFRRMRQLGIPARLIIAGPVDSPQTELLLASTRSEFGKDFDYRGAVAGDEKRQFFRDIDVFLFPSTYRNEAQPLVLIEAMGYGVPVIAYGRGCIGDDLGTSSVSVSPDDDFVAASTPILTKWENDRSALKAASDAALRRATKLYTEGQIGLERLIHYVT